MSISLFLEICTTGALIVGAYIAVRGLGEWKKQLKGNTEYDLARRTLIKTFKVRDAFQQVRNPFMSLKKEEVEEDLIPAEQREFQKRLEKLRADWTELYVEILETEALYGVELRKIFEPLINCKSELESQIWLYFWIKGAYAGPGATVDDNPERVMENREKVFQQSHKPAKDEITKQLNSAISNVEDYFRPKLKI